MDKMKEHFIMQRTPAGTLLDTYFHCVCGWNHMLRKRGR